MLGVKIEGDLNPVIRHRLLNEFGGRYEEMPVRTMSFSSAHGAALAWCRRSVEQPGHVGADRFRGHLKARPLFEW